MAELKFSSHFRSEEMVVPRNLNDFTSSTTSPAIKSSDNTLDNWGHKIPTQSKKRDVCIYYVHVCEQVR